MRTDKRQMGRAAPPCFALLLLGDAWGKHIISVSWGHQAQRPPALREGGSGPWPKSPNAAASDEWDIVPQIINRLLAAVALRLAWRICSAAAPTLQSNLIGANVKLRLAFVFAKRERAG